MQNHKQVCSSKASQSCESLMQHVAGHLLSVPGVLGGIHGPGFLHNLPKQVPLCSGFSHSLLSIIG